MDNNQDDNLSIGAGLLQIDSAFNLIKEAESISTLLSGINVEIDYLSNKSQKGIYIREKYQSLLPIDLNVSVQPIFVEHSSKF